MRGKLISTYDCPAGSHPDSPGTIPALFPPNLPLLSGHSEPFWGCLETRSSTDPHKRCRELNQHTEKTETNKPSRGKKMPFLSWTFSLRQRCRTSALTSKPEPKWTRYASSGDSLHAAHGGDRCFLLPGLSWWDHVYTFKTIQEVRPRGHSQMRYLPSARSGVHPSRPEPSLALSAVGRAGLPGRAPSPRPQRTFAGIGQTRQTETYWLLWV